MLLSHHRVGSGEPLLLIHGIGSRWQVWDPVLDRLAREREVIAIDLPGFGASPMPPAGTRPGVESLTGLVIEFLDALGLQAPHVGGNSLGGWLALELAWRGRARSATALSPAGFWNGPEAVFARATLRATVRAARLVAPVVGPVVSAAAMRRLVFAQLAVRGDRFRPDEAADTLRALGGAPWFDGTLEAMTRGRFAGGRTFGVPITIAWGEHDHLLLPRQAARAAAALPQARMITLEGCGHVPTYDDPGQVAAVLLAGSCGY